MIFLTDSHTITKHRGKRRFDVTNIGIHKGSLCIKTGVDATCEVVFLVQKSHGLCYTLELDLTESLGTVNFKIIGDSNIKLTVKGCSGENNRCNIQIFGYRAYQVTFVSGKVPAELEFVGRVNSASCVDIRAEAYGAISIPRVSKEAVIEDGCKVRAIIKHGDGCEVKSGSLTLVPIGRRAAVVLYDHKVVRYVGISVGMDTRVRPEEISMLPFVSTDVQDVLAQDVDELVRWFLEKFCDE
jgi:hypothetical protein